MVKRTRTYRLTPELVAAHSGGPVVCLDARAAGREFKLSARRPGVEMNERIRADVITPTGGVLDVTPAGAQDPAVTVVRISGPIEQRAGYHDMCGGWSDGHDAIAERMIMALEEGDVVMVIDSPGGAHAGLQEAIRRVVEEKAEHGRKVIAYADEMIGSAAYWWAAVVADEVYLPPAGVIGSIGARAAHCSIAGALAQEGVEPTYFAWPGPGKVAFAPELPLSDVGRERGERDVTLAGEAFAAAVAGARSLTREQIVELDADALTGQAAVNAGLADGVASLEDVMGFALAASSVQQETSMATTYERKTTERYEEEEDKKVEGDPESPDDPEADDEADDKRAEDEADDKRADGDEPDDPEARADSPDSEPPPPPAKAKRAAPPPPARMPSTKSIATMAGLREGASMPAIKSALIPIVQLAHHAMAMTETRTPAEALGALHALAQDAAASGELRTKLDGERAKNAARERMDLLRKLSSAGIPGYTRGELFVDEVDDASGKRTVRAAPVYAEMKLGTLRGLVETKLRNAGPRKATPFEPDADRSRSVSASGASTAAIEAAKKNPIVMRAAQTSYADLDTLARAYAEQFPTETGV